jgi:multidrug efflux pump subunit AcrB
LNDLGHQHHPHPTGHRRGRADAFPYGGKQRQIQVDLDLHALQAKGLSPTDVVNAVNAQNLIAPSGTMKIDRFEYASKPTPRLRWSTI